MGFEMPFTRQVVDKIRPERRQAAYASWGTLMHAELPPFGDGRSSSITSPAGGRRTFSSSGTPRPGSTSIRPSLDVTTKDAWAWLAPMPVDPAAAADRVERLVDEGRTLLTEFQPIAPEPESYWTQAREDDETYELPIPPGQHRLTLGNVGGDWACVGWYAFVGETARP